LPAPQAGKLWRLSIDTFGDDTVEQDFGSGESLAIETRSVKSLVETNGDQRRA
jgi:hypothetical protein